MKNIERMSQKGQSTGGGSRTHTGREAHWILSPARLPIPPLRLVQNTTSTDYTLKPILATNHPVSFS